MTADNGCLVSDEQNRIGFDEIHKLVKLDRFALTCCSLLFLFKDAF